MSNCPGCTRALDGGLLYLDNRHGLISDQARAAWKSCPRCSALAGFHVYLPTPDAFGTSLKRVTAKNPMGVHSWCEFHRNRKHHGLDNPAPLRFGCALTAEPAGRGPPQSDPEPPTPPPEVQLTAEQLDVLVGEQVGWIDLSTEGRKVLRTHLEAERKPGNRRLFIRMRSLKGDLACDACGADLAEVYGEEHAEVLELHHRRPLAHGVQKAKSLNAFALLCPTCHRVVHYRREVPLEVADVKRLLGIV